MDVDTHGLLSMIEYNQFRKFEPSHKQGIKLCKNRRSFNNCVVQYDDNLDLLTTDYGICPTDDEIYNTIAVVMEMQTEYSVIIFDVPFQKLKLFDEIILVGTVVITVEQTIRGFMNILCQLEDIELSNRLKRNIAGSGKIVLTKVNNKYPPKKLVKYCQDIVDLDEVDWLSMPMMARENKIDTKFLDFIVD
jgi:hypothetical protein